MTSILVSIPIAIISTNADPIHWRIYVALGGDETSTITALAIDLDYDLSRAIGVWGET